MSGTTHPAETSIDDGGEPGETPAEEFNVLGIVVVLILYTYAVVGILALLVGAYGLLQGWTIGFGRPYWASITWPVGAVGFLVPGLMELDVVTEVERTPTVWEKAVAGYGSAAVGLAIGLVLSFYPVGLAGLFATVAFTVSSLKYVWER